MSEKTFLRVLGPILAQNCILKKKKSCQICPKILKISDFFEFHKVIK